VRGRGRECREVAGVSGRFEGRGNKKKGRRVRCGTEERGRGGREEEREGGGGQRGRERRREREDSGGGGEGGRVEHMGGG